MQRVIKIALCFLFVQILIFVQTDSTQAAYSSDKVDFSGTWVLDKSKSEIPSQYKGGIAGKYGGEGMHIATQLEVKHAEPELKVSQVLEIEDQKKTLTSVYRTDGQETTNPGLLPNISIVSKASWDGNRLIIDSTRNVETRRRTGQVKSKQVWSLSSDGNTLSIEMTVMTPQGERTAKLSYHKS